MNIHIFRRNIKTAPTPLQQQPQRLGAECRHLLQSESGNTLKLSYSTRINRPGISQLNPAIVESPSSISTGNPDLGSSRYQSLSLNYNLISRKLTLDFNASYSFTNNSVISVQELVENDILKSTYANAGHNKTSISRCGDNGR